jgi:hypothetical protein
MEHRFLVHWLVIGRPGRVVSGPLVNRLVIFGLGLMVNGPGVVNMRLPLSVVGHFGDVAGVPIDLENDKFRFSL